MNLRIAWLGPWNEQSAIAAFGFEVVSELESRGCAVTVYRSEMGSLLALPPLPGERPVSELTGQKTRELLVSFDHVIANIGDHFGFHGAILPILPELGATVIFHDGFIANLAAGYISANTTSLDTHKAAVRFTYGADAIPDQVNVWDAPLEMIAAERPMTEWLARLAAGCVTHSGLWSDRFQKACVGPVQIIPLCYPDLGVLEPFPIGETLTISTVGYINPNKQADQVLKALASDPMLASRCRYQLLGQITPAQRDRISKLAETLGIPAPHFAGRLSDSDLRAALAETDIIACLRHPILESGSASFITALLSARPTLVSHQAHYAEVPEGMVLPCRPGDEAADVARHLRWILDNPTEARAMGSRARKYALATHARDRYVDKLLDLAARATEVSPVVRAALRLGQVLGSFGADINDPAAERIARTLSSGLPS
jgi:hypothetical protein